MCNVVRCSASQHKKNKKKKWEKQRQQVQVTVTTRFIRGRRPKTNQEHDFHPKVWWTKTGDYPDPKVTNIFIQRQLQSKNNKQNYFVDRVECLFCGPWNLKLKPKNKAFDNVELVTLFKCLIMLN